MARTSGTQAMYPSLPNNVTTTDVASLIAGDPITTEGVPAMAFTNAIFVDADGGGWTAPLCAALTYNSPRVLPPSTWITAPVT